MVFPEPLVVSDPVLVIIRQLRNDFHVNKDTLLLVQKLAQVNCGILSDHLVSLRNEGDVLLMARDHLEGGLVCFFFRYGALSPACLRGGGP